MDYIHSNKRHLIYFIFIFSFSHMNGVHPKKCFWHIHLHPLNTLQRNFSSEKGAEKKKEPKYKNEYCVCTQLYVQPQYSRDIWALGRRFFCSFFSFTDLNTLLIYFFYFFVYKRTEIYCPFVVPVFFFFS